MSRTRTLAPQAVTETATEIQETITYSKEVEIQETSTHSNVVVEAVVSDLQTDSQTDLDLADTEA